MQPLPSRRAVLYGVGSTVMAVGIGGCLGLGNDKETVPSPSIPEGMTVETLYDKRDFIRDTPSLRGGPIEAYEVVEVLIRDSETAKESFVGYEELDTFVERTGFTDSYLLLIQYATRPAEDLHLDSIEQHNNGMQVTIYVEDNPGGDALATHSLLLRITEPVNEIPESVAIDLEGHAPFIEETTSR